MKEVKIIQLPAPRNIFYHLAGLCILFLNKIRHTIQGYSTPRTFPISEIDRAIEYDTTVVNQWLSALQEFSGQNITLDDRTILELGPGADLGIGLTILSMGAKKYNSLDIHNLVSSVPVEFYDRLFKRAADNGISTDVIDELRKQLDKTASGNNDRLNYICRDDFDINVFKDEGIDTVFSQAAFEHFDDIRATFASLSKIVKPGAFLIAEIDLNTHTRWLRDVDPLNIYRYNDFYYNLCKFTGSPSRLNASEYKEALEQNGWENVQITPLVCVDHNYLQKVKPKLARRFRAKSKEIGYLSILVHAKKT